MSGVGATPALMGAERRIHEEAGLALGATHDVAFAENALNRSSGDVELAREGQFGNSAHIERADMRAVEGYSPISADPTRPERPMKDAGSDAGKGSSSFRRDAGEIFPDRVIEKRRVSFSGYVYNLQTASGWYVAEGIITHNCECALAPVIEPPTRH
jgi:hypothetical protein